MEEKTIKGVVIHDSHGNVVDEAPIYPQGTEELVNQHNADQDAHPHIKEAITGLRTKVEDRITDLVIVKRDGTEESKAEVDSQGNKIAVLNEADLGKVAGIIVNDSEEDEPIDQDGKVHLTIPQNVSDLEDADEYATKEDAQAMVDEAKVTGASVDYQEDGGSPSATVNFSEGSLGFTLKNMKMKFSDLEPEEIEQLRGPQGIPGQSVIVGEGDLPLERYVSQADNKAITPKAVDKALIEATKYALTEIDLSELTENAYYIVVSANKWVASSGAYANRRCKLVPVTEGRYLICKEVGKASVVAVLKTNNYSNNTTPNYDTMGAVRNFFVYDNKMVVNVSPNGTLLYFTSKDDNAEEIGINIFRVGESALAQDLGDSDEKAISQKAVKDAMVAENLKAANGETKGEEDILGDTSWSVSNAYINGVAKTVATSNGYKASNHIFVKKYKYVRVSICNTSAVTGILFYDASLTPIVGENGRGDYSSTGEVYIDKIVKVPEGAISLRITKSTNYESQALPYCYGIQGEGGISEISDIKKSIQNLMLCDEYETLNVPWKSGYVNNSGTFVESSSYAIMNGLIETKNIRRIRYVGVQDELNPVKISVAMYNENKTFVIQKQYYSDDFTDLPCDGFPYIRLWFACDNAAQAGSLIEITKWVEVKEQVEYLQGLFDLQSIAIVDFDGSNDTAILKYFTAKAGRIYKFTPAKSQWLVTAVFNGTVVFGVFVNSQYIARVTKGQQAGECYYAPQTDVDVQVIFRGNAGTKLDVLIEDVTLKFNSLKYDVVFVDKEDTQESMMVKLGQGDLARYIVNSDGENPVIKVYSRARRDEDYLVDSIVLGQGANEGEYMPTEDVFLVVESVKLTNFTPSFKVYNVGDAKNELTYPHQLKFDSANIQVLLSTQDEDVTIYDDGIINYGQIIEHNGVYVMLYQAFGSWDGTDSATIMMAYSTDGENWQRGIPEGLPVPYEGTNIVIRGDGQIVGLFSEEHIDSFYACRVNDAEYPYRILATVRKTPSSIYGERYWLFKSANLTQWVPIKQVSEKGHDTIPSIVSYGDCIKAYVRMWDYSKPASDQRMVGVMWMDLNGNVLVPPSGLYGPGLYNTAVTRIGPDRELAIPTHFYAEDNVMVGTDELETYIIEKDRLIYAPSYGIDELKYPETRGWVWGVGLCAIGLNQYCLYSRRSLNHASELEDADVQLCLCPIKWVTYNTANRSS